MTQTVMLLRYFRLDEVMGNLVTAIGGLLKDLGRFLMIIGLIIIPYGLIQENFIYPNQFLQSLGSTDQNQWIGRSEPDHDQSENFGPNGPWISVQSLEEKYIFTYEADENGNIKNDSEINLRVNNLKNSVEEEYQIDVMDVLLNLGMVLTTFGTVTQRWKQNPRRKTWLYN